MKQNAMSESTLCISNPNFIESKTSDHIVFVENSKERKVSKEIIRRKILDETQDKYLLILMKAAIDGDNLLVNGLKSIKSFNFKNIINSAIEKFAQNGLEEETDFLLKHGGGVEYAAFCAINIGDYGYADKLLSKIPDLHNLAFIALDTKRFSYLEDLRLSGKVGIEYIMAQLTAYNDIEYNHYFAYLASVNLMNCNIKKNESVLKMYLSNEINAVRFFSSLSHEFYINYAHLIDEKNKNIIIRSREVVLNPKKLDMEHINADSAYFYLKEREMMVKGKITEGGVAAILLYYPLYKNRTSEEGEEFAKANQLTPIYKIPPEIITHIVNMCFKHSERDKSYPENILASVKERVVAEWTERVFGKNFTVAHSL
ncbi:hypothetical protein I862_02405 [endosymbiont of Acanthamoeba sp. UWC8]|nr:hypothetical protein I862_02405 [endosymbiont of Acanthamoeba sp. UWC8]